MKEKKYTLYGIGVILISLIGISLAYFATQIVGKEKDISVNTKDLRIIFNNGDAITGENVVAEDNWSMTKTFSVENKSNSTYKYNIVIKDLINTFKTTGYLQYKITSTDGGYNMTSFEDVPKRSTATDTVLAYSVSIEAGVTQNYTITIQYPNDANIDQSDDMGAELSGKLYISEGTEGPKLLTEAILRDNPTISERTDFSVTNTENTTGTIYQTNKAENGSTVYYYSGNTTNNWVKFGEFYWRIIRTNEDESVRLLYSGTSPNTTNGYIGKTSFNRGYLDPMCVGYMYGTRGSLENNRNNTKDSTIKAFIDTWYQNNLLTDYDKYISKSAIYCNDRSAQDNSYSTTTTFNYGTTIRLVTNKTPTYKCGGDGNDGLFETTQALADKFSASTTGGGNGQLKYPIALMTADELVFAGGRTTGSPYAWYYTNSQGESIVGTNHWWSLSPHDWDGSYAYVWYVSGSSNPASLGNYNVRGDFVVRPSLSLSSCVKVTGIGTPDDPYAVDYENSCK